MVKPFVSHDGPDSNGVRAEVYVQVGTGTVKKLVESGTNVQAEIVAEHLRHPIKGWFAKTEPFYATLVEAQKNGREISYRTESQRKRTVDRSLPIGPLRETTDLARENCIMVLAAVDGVMSSEAVTNPAEDPNPSGRIRATAPEPTPAPQQGAPQQGAVPATGPALSPDNALRGLAAARQAGMPQSVIDASAALALAAGASVKQINSAGFDAQSERTERTPQRAFAAEAAPYQAYNTDGRMNLGSYAVQAAAGAEGLATDLLWADEVASAERFNASVDAGENEGPKVTPNPPNFKVAALLGMVFLGLADRVQVAVYGGGRPDRQANSHTRARGLVYDAIKHRFPVPFGQDTDVQTVWKDAVVEEAVTRFQFIVKIASEDAAETSDSAQGETPDQASPQPAEATDSPAAPAPQTAQGAPVAQGEPSTEGPVEAPVAGGAMNAPTAQPAAHPTQAPQVDQADQAGSVRQIGSEHVERPRIPIEGDADFVAPTQEILQRFGALAQQAGFEPVPDSPIAAYLLSKFKVSTARKVHGESLHTLVSWFEERDDAAGRFRQHVLNEASTQQSA